MIERPLEVEVSLDRDDYFFRVLKDKDAKKAINGTELDASCFNLGETYEVWKLLKNGEVIYFWGGCKGISATSYMEREGWEEVVLFEVIGEPQRGKENKMPKINQEEYEVLKNLDDKWKWIARNYNGALITFTSKPTENPNLYWDGFGERMDDRLFQFIQWADPEPYNISELIEEYEIKELRLAPSRTVIVDSFNESEEAEVKNIEWLKGKVLELQNNGDVEVNQTEAERGIGRLQKWAWNNCADRVYDLINQLDEPEVTLDKAFEKVAESYSMTKEEVWRQLERFETRTGVLSQEWVSDNAVVGQYPDGMGYVVPAYRLQNLLVPKQEEVDDYTKGWTDGIAAYVEDLHSGENLVVIKKPTIPPEADELIRRGKSRGETLTNTIGLMKFAGWNRSPYADGAEWAVNNLSDFVIAWEHGYEVEEEPQYIIKTGDERYLSQLALNYVDNPPVTTVHHMKEMAIRFSDRELAHKVADLVNNGEVEELEENV